MSLAGASLGCRCRVKGIRAGHPLSYRLMELGLIQGAEVRVLRRAPLGCPLQVRVGDYDLALRMSEAELIDVTEA